MKKVLLLFFLISCGCVSANFTAYKNDLERLKREREAEEDRAVRRARALVVVADETLLLFEPDMFALVTAWARNGYKKRDKIEIDKKYSARIQLKYRYADFKDCDRFAEAYPEKMKVKPSDIPPGGEKFLHMAALENCYQADHNTKVLDMHNQEIREIELFYKNEEEKAYNRYVSERNYEQQQLQAVRTNMNNLSNSINQQKMIQQNQEVIDSLNGR